MLRGAAGYGRRARSLTLASRNDGVLHRISVLAGMRSSASSRSASPARPAGGLLRGPPGRAENTAVGSRADLKHGRREDCLWRKADLGSSPSGVRFV